MLISLPTSKDKTLVPPRTPYCYLTIKTDNSGHSKVLHCPYWEIRPDKPEQDNGYCHYLEKGDWEEDGIPLLWDSVKSCGENWDAPNDIRHYAEDGFDVEYTKEIIAWAEKVLPLIVDEIYKEEVLKWIEKMRREVENQK